MPRVAATTFLLLVVAAGTLAAEPQVIRSLSRSGACLDRTSSVSEHAQTQLWECNGSGAQRWLYQDGNIVNPSSGLCLSAHPEDSRSTLRPVRMETCRPSCSLQVWEYLPRQHWIVLKGEHTLCLSTAQLSDGAALAVERCIGKAHLKWDWRFEEAGRAAELSEGAVCSAHTHCGDSCCCGSKCTACWNCDAELSKQGTRVEATWVDGWWYSGVTTTPVNANGRSRVLFDDGDQYSTTLAGMRLLRPWAPGTMVQAIPENGRHFRPAHVLNCPHDCSPQRADCAPTQSSSCQLQFQGAEHPAVQVVPLRGIRRHTSDNRPLGNSESDEAPTTTSAPPPGTVQIQVTQQLLQQLLQEGQGRSSLELSTATEGSAALALLQLMAAQVSGGAVVGTEMSGLSAGTCAPMTYGPALVRPRARGGGPTVTIFDPQQLQPTASGVVRSLTSIPRWRRWAEPLQGSTALSLRRMLALEAELKVTSS